MQHLCLKWNFQCARGTHKKTFTALENRHNNVKSVRKKVLLPRSTIRLSITFFLRFSYLQFCSPWLFDFMSAKEIPLHCFGLQAKPTHTHTINVTYIPEWPNGARSRSHSPSAHNVIYSVQGNTKMCIYGIFMRGHYLAESQRVFLYALWFSDFRVCERLWLCVSVCRGSSERSFSSGTWLPFSACGLVGWV